jgi:acrylyl-CoA reductase (NADPH)
VAACGLAQGADLPATVMPFILRGVALLGVDSVMAPAARRREAWRAPGARPRPAAPGVDGHRIGLEQVPEAAARLMAGQVRGRVVVRIG